MGIFGSGSRANKPVSKSTAMRSQTSVNGRPLAIGAGQNRLAGNLIYFGDYKSKQHESNSGGGKGGAFSGKGATNGYDYSATIMVSIGQTIEQVMSINNGTQYDFFYTPPAALTAALLARGMTVTTKNTFGATFLTGGYAQSPWSYMSSAHPTQALNYRGEALACFANMALGQNPALPNFNFEVLWVTNTDVAALGPDANPADWVTEVLTNADWGAGFPSYLLDDLSEFRSWCRATGMMISPLLTGQEALNGHLAELMHATTCEFLWTGGVLKVLPYADTDVTGNGYTYNAETAPIYELIESDFMPVTHGPDTGSESSVVKVSRRDPIEVVNQISVEYLDRANLYNPVILTEKNEPLIIASGNTNAADVRQHHFFCLATSAKRSAGLQIRRAQVMQNYFFRLPPQFILLDVMDLVSLTTESAGLDAEVVRIIEITKNDDGSLNFTAEEFFGADEPELYERQDPLGDMSNANEDPGDIDTPLIFEPPAGATKGALEVWVAITGADLDSWGGCNVWLAASDGETYQQVGQVVGPTRMGTLTATLPTIAEAFTGQTIDQTNTLSVDLTMSEGELTSGSTSDYLNLNTACYVDGEIIAYKTATLTATNKYDLTTMVRGALGSDIGAHASGTNFVRLDQRIVKIPFDGSRVGQAVNLKFQSFNVFGGGVQDLADIDPYSYTILGTALSSVPADVTNIRTTYKDKITAVMWDEIVDFRNVLYEVRVGSSWKNSILRGRVAHPPFTTFGDGTYWVKSRVEPLSGLVVYSDNALSQTLSGSVLPANILATWDEAALGWTGTVEGDGQISGGNFETTAANSIAYYYEPAAHYALSNYDRAILLDSKLTVSGVPINDDILAEPDFLGIADLLSDSASAYVDGWVEVFVVVSGDNDVFAPADIFTVPDVFSVGDGAGSWVKYAPGSVTGIIVARRLAIITYSDEITAVATAFTNSASVETRADHVVNYSLAATGETFTFRPDDALADAAFQGGPNGATYPAVFVAIQNQANGDYWTATSLSLTSVFIRCFNAGVGVARTVNITFEGY